MKNIKFNTSILTDEIDNEFGHFFTAYVRPIMKQLHHIECKVHDVIRFNDKDEQVTMYTIDDGECSFSTPKQAIKACKEMMKNNQVLDFIFDNELEHLVFN